MMVKKNIVFTIHNFSGAQTYADQIRAHLAGKEDVKFSIVFFGSPRFRQFTVVEEDDVMLFYFPFPGKRKVELYSRRVVDLLVPWFGDKENLILHLNSPYQYWFGYHFKHRFSSQIVYTVHYLINKFTSSYLKGDGYGKVKDIGGSGDTMNISDRVICVTDFARNVYESREFPNVVRIYNGYGALPDGYRASDDRLRLSLREDFGFNKEDIILLYVGRIDDSKGCDILTGAMSGVIKRHKNVRLIIAGDGNYRLCLSRVGLNCGRIMLAGHVPHEQLKQLYRLSDVGIIPSLWEQCSYVALEMMSNSLPVLYADVPGLNELFRDGYNGLRIPVQPQGEKYGLSVKTGDIEDAVARFMTYGNHQRMMLGANSYSEWEKHYRRETMGEEICKIYDDMIGNGSFRK